MVDRLETPGAASSSFDIDAAKMKVDRIESWPPHWWKNVLLVSV